MRTLAGRPSSNLGQVQSPLEILIPPTWAVLPGVLAPGSKTANPHWPFRAPNHHCLFWEVLLCLRTRCTLYPCIQSPCTCATGLAEYPSGRHKSAQLNLIKKELKIQYVANAIVKPPIRMQIPKGIYLLNSLILIIFIFILVWFFRKVCLVFFCVALTV